MFAYKFVKAILKYNQTISYLHVGKRKIEFCSKRNEKVHFKAVYIRLKVYTFAD